MPNSLLQNHDRPATQQRLGGRPAFGDALKDVIKDTFPATGTNKIRVDRSKVGFQAAAQRIAAEAEEDLKIENLIPDDDEDDESVKLHKQSQV